MRRRLLNKGTTSACEDRGDGEDDDDDDDDDDDRQAPLGDAVCALCESGGLLDTCDGCAQSWHAECIGSKVFAAKCLQHP